jgi:hypothetical protein
VRERVEERDRPVVERVVVGERHRVDAELGQPLRGDGRGPKEERLVWIGEALAALGDAALEVEHEEVGARGRLGDLRGDQRRARVVAQTLGDPAAQHRVAGERKTERAPPASADQILGALH